jgi:secreted Zn-dependent insulinase-like peptidase
MMTSFLSPDKYIVSASYKREIEKLEQSYLNSTMKADKAARNARLTALKPIKRCPNRKLSALRSDAITLESLSIYMLEFLSNICVDMFVYGNISSNETVTFSENIESIYNSYCSNSTMSDKNRPDQQIIKIPTDEVVIYTVSPRNLLEKNICVEFYYQLSEYDIVSDTQLELLEHLLNEPFFDSLRTKQQVYFFVLLFYIFIYFKIIFIAWLCSGCRGEENIWCTRLVLIINLCTYI